jgi:PAS domain-containing protein
MPSDDAAELQALFAELSESVAVYGLDSSIIYLNAAAERTLGEPLERLRGQRLFERLSQAAEGSSFQMAFERVVAGGGSESFELYFGPWDAWFAGRVARVGQRVHAVWREVTEDVGRPPPQHKNRGITEVQKK